MVLNVGVLGSLGFGLCLRVLESSGLRFFPSLLPPYPLAPSTARHKKSVSTFSTEHAPLVTKASSVSFTSADSASAPHVSSHVSRAQLVASSAASLTSSTSLELIKKARTLVKLWDFAGNDAYVRPKP